MRQALFCTWNAKSRQLMRIMSGNDEYEQLLNQTTNNLKQNKLKGDELTMKKIVSLGFDEARAEARAEGRTEGKAEGRAQEKFATAKRMLALGKSLQDIMLITDLPMNKIQELQAKMQAWKRKFHGANFFQLYRYACRKRS